MFQPMSGSRAKSQTTLDEFLCPQQPKILKPVQLVTRINTAIQRGRQHTVNLDRPGHYG
jgi:hypothetical protein